MSEISPRTARDYALREHQREIEAEDAAKEVREELLAAIDEHRLPDLSPETVRLARQAAPYGEYPSHKVLLMCFEHVLPQ